MNKLVPWCAWLLSSALEILRLRLRYVAEHKIDTLGYVDPIMAIPNILQSIVAVVVDVLIGEIFL